MLCIQKGAISPKSLHIAASDISQGQNWCCVFKKVQYRLSLCILLHPIYHKDRTGVVYSKRCNIAKVFAYCYIRSITRTKLVSCIQKGPISPMSLHMCIQKGAISPNLCILLHPIYHKDKTGVLFSKRCNIAYVFAYVYSKWCNIAQVVAY